MHVTGITAEYAGRGLARHHRPQGESSAPVGTTSCPSPTGGGAPAEQRAREIEHGRQELQQRLNVLRDQGTDVDGPRGPGSAVPGGRGHRGTQPSLPGTPFAGGVPLPAAQFGLDRNDPHTEPLPGRTMTVLWGRQIVVNVAGLVITGPRITFRVEHHSDDTGSNSRIVLYNLSPNRRGQIHDRLGGRMPPGRPTKPTAATPRPSSWKAPFRRSPRSGATWPTRSSWTLGGPDTRADSGGVTSRSYSRAEPDSTGGQGLGRRPGDCPSATPTSYRRRPTVTKLGILRGSPPTASPKCCAAPAALGTTPTGSCGSTVPVSSTPDAPVVSVNPGQRLGRHPLYHRRRRRGHHASEPASPPSEASSKSTPATNPGRWKVVHVIHEGDDWPVHGGRFVTHAELRPIE